MTAAWPTLGAVHRDDCGSVVPKRGTCALRCALAASAAPRPAPASTGQVLRDPRVSFNSERVQRSFFNSRRRSGAFSIFLRGLRPRMRRYCPAIPKPSSLANQCSTGRVYLAPNVGRVRSPAHRPCCFQLQPARPLTCPCRRVCGHACRELDGARYGCPVSGVFFSPSLYWRFRKGQNRRQHKFS